MANTDSTWWHSPYDVDDLDGRNYLLPADEAPGSAYVPAGDIAGQVNADMRAAWRGETD